MRFVSGAQTDRGLVRQKNEDSYCAEDHSGFFAVADGIGGRASGEVASRIAIDVMQDFLGKGEKNTVHTTIQSNISKNPLTEAVHLANRAVYEKSLNNPELQGMGTTIAAALIDRERLSIAHVGDSRVYLLRSYILEQLTDDHSLQSEAMKPDVVKKGTPEWFNKKNIITRALGTDPDVEVSYSELTLNDGDVLILCTDGLTSMVSDSTIQSTIKATNDPAVACSNLVGHAMQNGGKDNITVIIIYIYRERWFHFVQYLSQLLRR